MRRIVPFVLMAGLIGCSSGTEPDSPYIGSYTLSSINGEPAWSQRPDGTLHITSGAIWLDSNRTYRAYALTQVCYTNGCTGPEVNFGSTGTWTRTNSQFTLVDSSTGESKVWSYEADKLTVTDTKNFPSPGILIFAKDSVTRPLS